MLFKICLKEKTCITSKNLRYTIEFYNQTFISNGVDWVLKSKSVSANPNMNDVSNSCKMKKNNEKTNSI